MGLSTALLALAVLQASTTTPTTGSETTPTVRGSPATASIQIDGRLDEPDWERAEPASSFRQIDPDEGKPASERTEVRVLFDGEALYIGAVMFDSDPSAIVSRLARRDNATTDSDWFEVFLDSYHDHLTAFEFGITPAGSILDASIGADGNGDLSWDPVWESQARIDSRGWVVEIRIPLSQLRYSEQADAVWGVQFTRKILRKQETDLFAFTPKSENEGTNRYGHLIGLGHVRAPKRLEFLPHALVRGEYTNVDPGSPFRDGHDYFGDMGLEMKYGVTSALTLDASVRPDFGQAEVDPAEINLSAFETKFDEKRPFFIEGADQFRFGRFRYSGGSDFPQLFFSRRIGRAPARALSSSRYQFAEVPNETTILGAAKVTGKMSGRFQQWSVGVLDAVTPGEQAPYLDALDLRQSANVEPLSNYFAARLGRELREGDTAVGALVTAVNRNLDDPALASLLRSSALVAGVDLNHSWNHRSWAFDGALVASTIQGSTAAITSAQRSSARYFQRPDVSYVHLDKSRTGLGGHAAQFGLTRLAGRHWRGSVGYQQVSPGFESNDLGFQRYADFRTLAATVDYRENQPRPVIRNWRVRGYTRQNWNFGGTHVGNGVGVYSQAQFSNYWLVSSQLDVNLQAFDAGLTRGGPLAVSPAAVAYTASVNTDDRQPFQLSGSSTYVTDKGGGRTTSAYLSLTLNSSPRLRFSATPSITSSHATAQYTTQVEDPLATNTFGQRYVFAALDEATFALSTRADWTFTPRVSLQAYVQPFVGSGDYSNFSEFAEPRTYRFDRYGRDRGTIARDASGDYSIDPDGPTGPASPFTLYDPNFDVRTVRSSVVLRWEYRPGSTFFVAFQRRSAGESALVLKATYWFGL